MSDNNDKKPASTPSGWPAPHEQAREGRGAGQAIEDPLAELDRIVNQDFGLTGQNEGRSASVSSEDLRILEQELIRELRGHQEAEQPVAPQDYGHTQAEPLAPTPVATRAPAPVEAPRPTAAPVPETVADQLSRPHPLAHATHRPAPQALVEPRVEVPAPAVPVATMPTSNATSEPVRKAPSLDDWSNLFDEPAPEASAPATPASMHGEAMATSGSYGQLSRQAGQPPHEAPAVAATPAASEHRYADAAAVDYRAAQTESRERAEATAPAVSASRGPDIRAPETSVSETWNEIIARQTPIVDPSPDYRHVSSATPTASAPREPYVAPSIDRDNYASASVPEVTAPIESDPATDPYAAFNQAPADPYSGYDERSRAAGAAPAVDVSGQGPHYAAPTEHYHDDVRYADPNTASYADPAQPTYEQGYAAEYDAQNGSVGRDDLTANGAYGTYADPGVAYAAAESAPYYQNEDYQTLETEAAIAAAVQPRKSRKGLIAALAVVGVVAVGGLIAWGFGNSGNGGDTAPPLLTADNGPVKETPDDPGGKVIPHQNKTVYDRIDGSESDEGPSNLMPATETPLAMTADGQTPRVISLSGGESNVAQNSSAVAPKQVRTVVVRPDGTIVNTNGAAANETQVASVDTQMLNATPSEQAMTQTFNNGVDGAGNASGLGAQDAQGANGATAPLPRAKPAELVALQAANRTVAAPVVQQTQTAPLVLAPPVPQATAPAATNTSGGYTVQVTSQRSVEQARASFNSIQAQLPSVLGGYQPDIKQADLGARGTYYRVRVGSFADRAGATSFCSQIKAAGGDCLVAQK
ncbi:SPOR domain-containing protein [Cohaesibacter celericrescens]|uniref:SPOR domain-containing protein n=1 Tax=Cohaesibacter celericrescens TaxID=2067669 RepID=A0A2N5XT00_9HYPH|nr:SPOR domain-containing protein [Cohaesibacter celericrescens]PLW77585.1 hypothetical protein C0081_09760 [Cohaesibacter celericrescens]